MASAIISEASPPAAKPVTPPLQQRLNVELEAAHLAVERLFSVIDMVVDSLYGRDAGCDHGLAICLENAAEVELRPARARIQDALKLVSEAGHG